MNKAAAVTAAEAPIISHACQAGRNVCRYLSEPMSMNSAADPAMEIPSAINTAPIMLMIRILLRRAFRAASCLLRYCFMVAFTSSKNWVSSCLKDIKPPQTVSALTALSHAVGCYLI